MISMNEQSSAVGAETPAMRSGFPNYFDKPFRVVQILVTIVAIGSLIGSSIVVVHPQRFIRLQGFSPLALGGAILAFFLASALWALAARVHRAHWWIFSFLILARIGVFFLFGNASFPGASDPSAYSLIARNILMGKGILLDSFYDITTVKFWTLYPPLYPILLSAIYEFFGANPFSIFFLNLFVQILAAFSLFRLCRELHGAKAGIAAATIYLAWPVSIFSVIVAHKEDLAILLFSEVVLSFLRQRRGIALKESMRLGIAAGLLALCQPAWVSSVAFLGIIPLVALGWSRTLRVAGTAVPFFAAILLPWIVRNYVLYGTFVPLTSSYGISLLYVATNHFDALNQYYLTHHANELVGARAGWSMAIGVIHAHPAKYLLGRIVSLIYALCLETSNEVVFGTFSHSSIFLHFVAYVTQIFYAGMVAAAAHAIWRNRQQRMAWPLLILAALLAQMVVLGMWLEYGERHRYAITILLMVCVAINSASPRVRAAASPA